ncbi:alcohol dehydrogenase [Aspergillus ruber CBS 135680]|uniref:Alcohol dehydrogenase n=1 Tax=Aspergillus ruber (strain CBS 135680) TaxID=1388766 RepID=A0A017SHH6_ASPRC|nr:alcohol dehydrogenase [Aspergillus ruber CBS 135680]EYE96413.1 alcohol dehydrogenase [Aspergillus ruber CBS 135680]
MVLNATMQALIYNGTPYKVTIASVPRPTIQNRTDAVVRITTSAICAIGYVSEVGDAVSSLSVGDYVVIPDNAAAGHLEMVPEALDSFGGGTGLGGLQAEYALVPFADNSLIPVPLTHKTTNSSIERDYLTTGDIFATGWSAIDYSGFQLGDTVAVFGAGPVGLLAAYTALLHDASNVYAVDREPMHLERAASIGAIPVNFNESDPVRQIMNHEPNGVTRAVDCVGMEAVNARGDSDEGIILRNMIDAVAQNGGIGQVGVYMQQETPPAAPLGDSIPQNVSFPISDFFLKHLKYEAGLVELVSAGRARPSFISTAETRIEAPRYYEQFDRKEEIKVYIHFP